MNWEILEQEVKALADKIDYHPDLIVGISRGGIVPARLLIKYLEIKDLHCISVKKIGEERQVTTEINEDLKNKNILLVEDILETGRSLIKAKEYLETKGTTIKTCCLYTMPIAEIKPDFYLKEIKEPESFPWE